MSDPQPSPAHRRKWWWMLGLLGPVGLISGALLWGRGQRPEGAEVLSPAAGAPVHTLEDGRPLRVLTWNIHYGYGPTLDRGRGLGRDQVVGYLEQIAAQIRAWDPDIVALQEVDRGAVRSFDIDQLVWLREATGYPWAAWTETWNARWVPWPGLDPRRHIGRVRSGQAILSRFPLRDASRQGLPQPAAASFLYRSFYLHRAVLQVDVEVGPGREMRVINTHLEAFDIQNKREQAAILAHALQDMKGGALLLGDMNAVPTVATLRRGFPDEPETDMSDDDTLDRLAGIPGLHEVVPTAVYQAGESAWFTFPAAAPNRRLDYIFHGDAFRLVSARVGHLAEPPSDHLPVLAELAW